MAVEPTPSDGGRDGEVRQGTPERGGHGGEGPPEDDDGGFDPKVVAAALVATALVAGVTDYAAQQLTQELGPLVGLGIVAAVALPTLYLAATKRHPAQSIGTGLYVTSMIMILAPFMLYIPRITLQGERIRLFAQNVSATNVTIGGSAFFQAGSFSVGTVTSGDVDSIIGLVVFLVVFMLGALAVAVLGRLAKSYGSSRVEEQGARGAGRRPR